MRAGVVRVTAGPVLVECTAGETADQVEAPTSLTTAGTEITDDAPDITSHYEGVGDPGAETVLVFAQGGPASALDAKWFALLTDGLELDQLYVVTVHQAQTLDPEPFLTADIDFDAAKAADDESVQIAADVVAHFRASGKRVVVLASRSVPPSCKICSPHRATSPSTT